MRYADRVGALRPSAIRAAGKLIAAKPGCISFAAGYPSSTLMPIREVADLTRGLVGEQGKVSLQYGMTRGHSGLIEEIVKLMELKGIRCSAENIQITTGSQQGIFLSGLLSLNKGDAAAFENPTYLGALSAFAPCECRYVGIDADQHGMNMDALEKKLAADSNIKLIYVVANFSNPTGRTWSLDRRKRLLELAGKYNVLIVEDDPYGDIRFEGEPVPSIKSMDTEGRVIYLGSFSKVLCAGLRVGFTISDAKSAETFEIFKQGIDLQTNELAQMQVCAYLKNYDLSAQVQRISDSYRHKRDLMLAIADEKFPKGILRTHPEGGMFLWLELPEGTDALKLLEKSVAEIGVGFVPGGPFFVEPGHENTIRLNFSTVDEDKIVEGMNRLADFFARELPGA